MLGCMAACASAAESKDPDRNSSDTKNAVTLVKGFKIFFISFVSFTVEDTFRLIWLVCLNLFHGPGKRRRLIRL